MLYLHTIKKLLKNSPTVLKLEKYQKCKSSHARTDTNHNG